MDESKTCTHCGSTKPVGAFPWRKDRGTYSSWCRDCKNLERQLTRAANLEIFRERDRGRKERRRASRKAYNLKYQAANKERLLAAAQAYYLANRSRIDARHKAWADANPDRALVYKKRWRESHPEASAAIQHTRRARLKGASSGPIDLSALWTGFCGICDEPLTKALRFPHPQSPSIDHIVALANGGTHTQDNLQWACFGCNSRKGAL